MTYRPEEQRAGYLIVHYNDRSCHYVPRHHLEALEARMRAGEEFIEITNLLGAYLLLRTSYIHALEDAPVSSLEATDRADAEQKQHDQIGGGS